MQQRRFELPTVCRYQRDRYRGSSQHGSFFFRVGDGEPAAQWAYELNTITSWSVSAQP